MNLLVMKKNKIILYGILYLIIILTVSCNNKKKSQHSNVIQLESAVGNYNILNLSDYTMDIKYIPLETNDSALVGNVAQISYENDEIFIKSTNNLMYSCYLFDNNGKICRKIGNYGQGPYDYLDALISFIFENYIYIWDTIKNKLFIYDTNGALIGNIKLWINENAEKNCTYFYHHIFPLKKNIFVINASSFSGFYPKAILIETDLSNSRLIKEYPNYIKLDKVQPRYTFLDGGILYRFMDNVRVYKPTNDTIFTIDQSSEIKEAFIFELGKFSTPLSIAEGKRPLDDSENFIIPDNIFESIDHLFIVFRFGNNAPEPFEYTNSRGGKSINVRVYGVFDKNTGKLELMKQPIKGKLGFKNDIDNGPVIWPHYISSNNELVTYISPEEFLDYYDKIEKPTPQMTEIAKNTKMDDNPIVIIAKLKE